MAHVPKQPERAQEYQQPGQHIRASQIAAATTSLHQSSKDQQPKNQSTKIRTDSIKQNERNSFSRFSSQRHSKTLVTYPLETRKEPAELPLAGIPKPSKHFAKKCRAEFHSLLEAIKPDYHNDIKSLYEDETYVDLFIRIGDVDLKRPLHKCIIASRAFKFYCALKGFKVQSSNTEADIIVADLQAPDPDKKHITIPKQDTAGDKAEIFNQEEQLSDSAWAEKKEEQLRDALEVLVCELPEGLINIEFLSSFARRTYLDQDVTDDEVHLHLLVLDWLKINKPELIKVANTNRRSLDHRESFRTVQPDFEQLSISDNNSPAMSASEQSASELQRNAEDTTGGDTSQTCSIRDDNQAVTSLTRTETFEMLSRNNQDADLSEAIKVDDPTLDGDDKDHSELSVNTSESSEPYTPVTRTGLKPKKFTPIVGMKSSRSAKSTSTAKKSSDGDNSHGSHRKSAQSAANSTSGISTASPPVASKRSSLTTGASPTPESATCPPAPGRAQASSKSRNPAVTKTTPKIRQTIVTRAHPISLERSQSPATSLSKGSTKNFIAANKKLISQIEKKTASSTYQSEHQSQVNDDSENEVSDVSLLALTEPLSTDNLAANIDKFALVSYSKLADALSHMFIGGILTDMVVLAKDGKEINAHKCILAARSAYLNDQITKLSLPSMTSESSSSAKQLIKIDLTEYSYAAVYFSMMHIYSGVVKVPEDLELEELTKISHLLHVGTLRQVCMHNLRMNYCHYFHKPCNVCCIGVLKTLPLAWRYDLTELYTKCLQWIGANFAQIFCLEEFSNLKPRDLIEECYKETSSQLTPENVIQKTIECQKLLKSLPRVKWTESIICLVGRQLEDFCHYVADNYEKIIQSESFLALGKSCWECEVLEENLLAAMNHLKPDSGCKTLIQLDKIECSIETYCDEPRTVSETFANLISKMRKYCERYLLKDAAAVVHCSSWRMMNPSLQKKIKDQALIATDFDEPTRHLSTKPKLPSMSRHQQQGSSKSSPSPQPNNSPSDTKSPSNRSTPDSRLKSPNTTYLPPPKTKPAAARHVKVLK